MSTQGESQNKRILSGTVVSAAMDKTVVVEVTKVQSHSLYRKRYTITKKYKAHDESNSYAKGDLVSIQESRPYSKSKRWVVVNN